MRLIKFLFEDANLKEKFILIFTIIAYIADIAFPIYFIINNTAIIISIIILIAMGIIAGMFILIDILFFDEFSEKED